MYDSGQGYTNLAALASPTKVQRVVFTIFFLIVIAFGVGFALAGDNRKQVEAELLAKGTRVDGAIENRYISYDRSSSRRSYRNGPYYNIVVRYDVNGIPAHHTFQVAKGAYDGLYAGPSAALIYSPENPAVVVLPDGGDTGSGSSSVMGGLIIGGVGLVCLAAAWIYWIRTGA